MAEKKANPLIGAFRDSALDIVQPEKKTPEFSKTMEPVKAAPDKKTAEAAKPPAVDVKQKPEEAAKPSAADIKQKSEEAVKPTADVKQTTWAASVQEVEISKDFKMPINQKASESVTTLPLHEIKSFEGHPFSVKDDKDMQELVESVKRFGVLEPVVVKEYGYEMVSGHRRLRACQLAGINKIPVIIRNLDRDEAIISMVDANLKRENITLMEKARAYEMKLAAMKRKAGRRSKVEAANKIGYDLAMSLTKGQNPFIVCTHIDKAHIHSHIIFSAINLDCTRNFRNFWRSSFAIRKITDIVCLENGLSVIAEPQASRGNYTT